MKYVDSLAPGRSTLPVSEIRKELMKLPNSPDQTEACKEFTLQLSYGISVLGGSKGRLSISGKVVRSIFLHFGANEFPMEHEKQQHGQPRGLHKGLHVRPTPPCMKGSV